MKFRRTYEQYNTFFGMYGVISYRKLLILMDASFGGWIAYVYSEIKDAPDQKCEGRRRAAPV
jgi:hypothetical protein